MIHAEWVVVELVSAWNEQLQRNSLQKLKYPQHPLELTSAHGVWQMWPRSHCGAEFLHLASMLSHF